MLPLLLFIDRLAFLDLVRMEMANEVGRERWTLLSLDFVLEHPGMNWLPAEPEKVEFFEKLGLPRPLDSAPDLLRCGRQTEALLCAQTAPCRGA